MYKIMKQLFFILLIITATCNVFTDEKITDEELYKRAVKITDESITIDTHCDTPMHMYRGGYDIGVRNTTNHVDLVRMKEGGVDAMFFAVFISNDLADKHPSKRAYEIIETVYQQVEKNNNIAEMAFSPDDIHRIKQSGKRAVLLGIENGDPLEGSLILLHNYYRHGVRYITLTHVKNNHICDSSTDEPKWNGLSSFGIELVKEMNRIGMMIDVSHISDDAFYDVIENSSAPIMASHSGVRSICNSPRNLTDDMIKSVAKNKGVVQVVFYSGFLSEEYREKSETVRKDLQPLRAELKEIYKDNDEAFWKHYLDAMQKAGLESPDVEVLIDHIDYIVRLVGVDYVGIGSDFDGTSSVPLGLEDVSKYPVITYHLLKRGYKEEDIKKILGGNFLRVFSAVQNAALKKDSN